MLFAPGLNFLLHMFHHFFFLTDFEVEVEFPSIKRANSNS
jgi:hypothetical protein